jgi:aminoglycoside 6'-N-acetyltransferase
VTTAHVGGLPLEETLAACGPALLMVLGAAEARFRAHGMIGRSMRDGDLELRRFRDADGEGLDELFAEPDVKRWWPDSDYDRDDGWVVVVGGELAGWIQYEEETYEWYPSVALDIALTTKLHGRGYGRRVLRLAIEHFVAKGHHRFTIDPELANERAIRSYAAVGFKPVGVLRAYGRNAEGGGWHDGLLMDLVVLDGEWR